MPHRRLNIGQGLLHIRAKFKFHLNRRQAFIGIGHDFLNVGNRPQFRLKRLDNIGVDIFGRRARPGHRDADNFNIKTGEKLTVQAIERHKANDDHQDHQQIGRRFMANEEIEEWRGFHG